MPPADLVTLRHVAEILRVSRTTAWRYAKLKGFPAPKATIAGTRAWSRADVERWKDKGVSPQRGRPPKPSG